jgi:uncharacterized protein
MKKRIFVLLLLSLLVSDANAACNGSASIKVPAVVGDGAGLVTMQIRIIPGSGGVFLSTFPETGTSTQESLDNAAQYAFKKFGISNCDAVVNINTSGSAGYVDGPSAGAAFTVLTYGALEGLEPRDDSIITGTIDPNGGVGPVGGVYEKAMAAISAGAKYFVMPQRTFFDLLLLRNLESSHGIKVVEVTTVDEAIDFMLHNKSIASVSFERKPEPVPDLVSYDTTGIESFGDVASRMIASEKRVVDQLPETDNESTSIKNYFKSSIARQQAIAEKGYYFTAANDAFLDYIQVSTISAILKDSADLDTKKSEVQGCLQSLPEVAKTERNFEWVVGSELRKAWATNRINITDTAKPKLQEEKYLVYNDLMYSDAWCLVSGILAENADPNGQKINESSWQSLAQIKLSEAGQMQVTDADLKERLISAKTSYENGKYGASIFDSTYVIEMVNASRDMVAMSPEEMDGRVQLMLKEKRSSLWGKVYQAQGAFLSSENVSQTGSAYRIIRFAAEIDRTTDIMRKIAIPQPSSVEEQVASSPVIQQALLIMSTFLIITVLLLYIATRGHSQGRLYGTDPQSKRYRGVPRAGKKQG